MTLTPGGTGESAGRGQPRFPLRATGTHPCRLVLAQCHPESSFRSALLSALSAPPRLTTAFALLHDSAASIASATGKLLLASATQHLSASRLALSASSASPRLTTA